MPQAHIFGPARGGNENYEYLWGNLGDIDSVERTLATGFNNQLFRRKVKLACDRVVGGS